MKIGVVSDTHGKKYNWDNLVEKLSRVDLIFHLGDICADAMLLGSVIKVPVNYVRGNCDLTGKVPDSQIIEVENKRIFITHGHLYNVKSSLDRLVYKAQEIEADIVLFGHTHEPRVFFERGIMFMNPGSAACPRGGKRATAGIIQLVGDRIIPYIVNLND